MVLAAAVPAMAQPAAPPPVAGVAVPAAAAPMPADRLTAIDTAPLPPRAREAVAASLARWNRLSPPASGRWLLVNVPAYEIRLMDGPAVLGRWRAIVGKKKTPTPLFTGRATGVILNPWWDVPDSIVAEGVGKLMARHPARAAAQGYVRQGDRYRQKPGPENQLGLMKLDFINAFHVGIHDTPSRQLFARDKRAFSHGCIRVDDPFDFAAALLGAPASRDSLKTVVDANAETQRLPLAQPIPVIVGYFTAEVGDDGALVIHDDVYGRDRATAAPAGAGGECGP